MLSGSYVRDCVHMSDTMSSFLGLEFADNMAEFEGGPEFEAHVLHHHVTVEKQQGLAVDFLQIV